MNKKCFFYLLYIITIFNGIGQNIETSQDSLAHLFSELNDGPYLFVEGNELIEKEIVNGEIHTKILAPNLFDTLYPPEEVVFNNVKTIVAISDVHGQYDLVVELFKKNKLIDDNLNWKFGKGHLVILGDVFDRGDKVTELLWLIYKLEKQAKEQGGRVHFLLGNHEFMILQDDVRYLNRKYRLTTRLMNESYGQLYGVNTVLGRWLRSKNTILKINNNVFVHGGISKEFLSQNDFEPKKINDLMRSWIDIDRQNMKSNEHYNSFFGPNGILWYRGYFDDNLADGDISDILEHLDSEHIIVGHCSNKEVVQLFDQKIFGIDSSIKLGEYGEILWIKNNKYYRKTLDGKKKQFQKNAPTIH